MLTNTKMGAWKRFWFAVMLFAFRRGARHGLVNTMSCANRVEFTTKFGAHEARLVLRDTSQGDGYSRVELYEMLRIVRYHEQAMGWTCPEPTFRNEDFAKRFADKRVKKS
jgi:hypothetical protein